MAEKKTAGEKAPEYPDTPSGKALAAAGGVPADDASDEEKAKAAAKYEAEKRKHRWG